MALRATSGMDSVARTMAQNISTAMGGGPSAPDYTTWITDQFTAQFAAHAFTVSAPVTRTVALNTAYQATDPTKPAQIKVVFSTTTTVGIGSPQDNSFALYIGPTNAVASGTGTIGDSGGMALNVTLISLGLTATQSGQVLLPTGWYFAARRLTGTQTTVASAYDQSLSLA